MPNGKTHARATLYASIALGAGTLLITDNLPASLIAFSGGIFGIIINPDLDVDRGSFSHNVIEHGATMVARLPHQLLGLERNRFLRWTARTFGKLVAFLWWLFWFPYSWAIPHRSPLSQFPVISTAIRVIYVTIPIALLLYYTNYFVFDVPSLPYWIALISLGIVDTLHILMDAVL